MRFFIKQNKKITEKDIAILFRQLSVLLTAGIPLFQAIQSTRQYVSKIALKIILNHILLDMNQGFALSIALAKHPRQFDVLTCQLIKSGELSGTLDDMLKRIADHREKIVQLKSKIKKALIYPSAILITAIIMMGILLEMIIPQFQSLFEGVGVPLPWMTISIINLSVFIKLFGGFILIIIFGMMYLIYYLKKKNKNFSIKYDRILFNFPGLGEVLKKSWLTRWARTLATVFAAGVPLLEALKALGKIENNYVFLQAMQMLQRAISKGMSLCQAMQSTKFFPPLMIEMIAAGEASGNLDIMLEKIADYYENELQQLTESLLQWLEPMIIIILGVMIGVLVIAMYLPIFRLGMVI
jgi:type IV pilus assembly protein PilC